MPRCLLEKLLILLEKLLILLEKLLILLEKLLTLLEKLLTFLEKLLTLLEKLLTLLEKLLTFLEIPWLCVGYFLRTCVLRLSVAETKLFRSKIIEKNKWPNNICGAFK
jgi:hypothetical protein